MFVDDSNRNLKYNLRKKAVENFVPIDGTFELTPRCSMSCKMCYIVMNEQQIRDSGKREKTAKEWLNLAEECCKEGLLYLLLTGGEAMCRKDFREIYDGLSSMGLNIRLNSNGTLYTPDTLDWLVKHPPNRVNITLYGSSNETYERLCGLKNGYDIVKKAINDLIDANIEVKINSTITKYNYKDLDGILDFIQEHNLSSQVVNYSFPTRRRDGDNAISERINPNSAAELEFHTRSHLREPIFINYMAKSIEQGRSSTDHSPLSVRCSAGKCAFWITWDGRMLPCCLMDNVVANPFEEGFAESWKKITKATSEIYFPQKCWSCDYRHACVACPGVHYCENGKYDEVGQYACDFTKHFLNLVEERASIDEK